MALYRTISMSFWTDSKVVDDFTPEDKYFYLYLFTNPHTNLCGCYEISIKQMSYELGYSADSVLMLLKRFSDVHNVIKYSKETKEILLFNWHKYNWTSSEKYRKPLLSQIESIKLNEFKSYLMTLFNGTDDVSIPYEYPIDTSNTNTNTDTVSNSDKITKQEAESIFEKLWQEYPEKKGKGRVSYADKRKIAKIGEEHMTRAISRYINEIKQIGWKQYQNGSTFFHSGYVDYLDENFQKSVQKKERSKTSGFNNEEQREYNMDELEMKLLETN